MKIVFGIGVVLAVMVVITMSAPQLPGCGPTGCYQLNQNGQITGCGPTGCGVFGGSNYNQAPGAAQYTAAGSQYPAAGSQYPQKPSRSKPGAACGPRGCGPVQNNGYGVGCGPGGCGPNVPY